MTCAPFLTDPDKSGLAGSGCCGFGCHRVRCEGCERIADITRMVPYWFANDFCKWAGREAELLGAPENFGIVYREGGHGHTTDDWIRFMEFAAERI